MSKNNGALAAYAVEQLQIRRKQRMAIKKIVVEVKVPNGTLDGDITSHVKNAVGNQSTEVLGVTISDSNEESPAVEQPTEQPVQESSSTTTEDATETK